MNIETMIAIKKEFSISYSTISEASGVPISTVQKVLGGITKPRSSTAEALAKALTGFIKQGSPRWMGAVSFEELLISHDYNYILDLLRNYKTADSDYVVNEKRGFNVSGSHDNNYDLSKAVGFENKSSGEYEVSDYENLPEDIRVELIDGYFYEMEAPTKKHQVILQEILIQLTSQIRKNKGDCKVYMAPSDVQLDESNKTIVQPDLFILCNKDMIKNSRRTVGAPEFIIEVLSESTRKKDMTLKLNKYEACGVKEYWIIDPNKEYIIKYFFENMSMTNIYTFNDIVPLELYE
ncbi:MAG: Uma2 family endonuclease, partial [Eubacterium sp.]|nr:Uma2 family endonuclease [Eubacterium sp.]